MSLQSDLSKTVAPTAKNVNLGSRFRSEIQGFSVKGSKGIRRFRIKRAGFPVLVLRVRSRRKP